MEIIPEFMVLAPEDMVVKFVKIKMLKNKYSELIAISYVMTLRFQITSLTVVPSF